MKDKKLSDIKSAGFRTSSNYFEGFEDNLIERVVTENLKTKHKLSKETGFEIPKDYLLDFEKQIERKLKSSSDSKVMPLWLKKSYPYSIGIAAALLLMLNSFWTKDQTLSFETLDVVTIENYLNEEDLNAIDISLFVNDKDLILENFVESSFSTKDLENYLFNNLDIDTINLD